MGNLFEDVRKLVCADYESMEAVDLSALFMKDEDEAMKIADLMEQATARTHKVFAAFHGAYHMLEKDSHGKKTFRSPDYGAEGHKVSLKKSALGEFVYAVLKAGGKIVSTYVMDAKYDGSYVEMLVQATESQKEAIEKATGMKLAEPSRLVLA